MSMLKVCWAARIEDRIVPFLPHASVGLLGAASADHAIQSEGGAGIDEGQRLRYVVRTRAK